jgi:hypothetical protein
MKLLIKCVGEWKMTEISSLFLYNNKERTLK